MDESTLAATETDPRFAPTVEEIREHYDRLSPLYRRFWGEHIHHGFWRGDEDPATAQLNLTRELAARANLRGIDCVLDVGCGLGGSALWLAEHIGCRVTGVSISANQVLAAREEATRRRLADRVHFEVADANALSGAAGSYDVIWVIECSEHLFDKVGFVRTCARLLRPGGRLAICAWLAGETLNADQRRLVAAVRHGMLCPSFGTLADYTRWLEQAGLTVTTAEDITPQVVRTWQHCHPVLNQPVVRALLAAGGRRLRAFADSFAAIDEAYRTGAMAYGMFVAEKSTAR